jgi:hypothetical protein
MSLGGKPKERKRGFLVKGSTDKVVSSRVSPLKLITKKRIHARRIGVAIPNTACMSITEIVRLFFI